MISGLPYAQLRPLRRRMQMVFQDPYASLNPRKRVADIIAEPLQVHGIGTAQDRRAKVQELMARVRGLPVDAGGRFPHEFSAASASASASLARSPLIPRSSLPTSRSPRSTCRCRRRSST